MRLLVPARRLPRGDDGFSLVEAVVALFIASAVFTALAFALVGGAQATVLSRQNQQSGDVLNRVVEEARAIPYDSLAMVATDLDTGETGRSPSISSCQCYDPKADSTSGTGVEPLAATDPNGLVSPHVSTVTQNGQRYKIRRYVTVPSDTAGAYKRLTVVLSWSSLGKSHTRTYSTVIASTKRGLPLPDFKFTNLGSTGQCRNPASTVAYGFTLKNNGARDNWTVQASPSSSPSWSFYFDTDGNGAYGPGDAAMPLTAAGTPSTGLLDPTRSVTFFAVATVQDAATRPAPYTLTTTFRATSVAQSTFFQQLVTTTQVQTTACGAVATPTPTATPTSTATPTPTATPTGTPPAQPGASCSSLASATSNAPSGTAVRYYLYNATSPGNTSAQTSMPVSRDNGTPPTTGSLYNYSQDLHTLAGRRVDSTHPASWSYTLPGANTVKGDGTVTVWAATADGSSTGTPSFSVTVDVLSSSGSVVSTLGSASYSSPTSGWGCTGFRPVSLQVVSQNGNGIDLSANQQLRVTVAAAGGSTFRLAYGTAGYPMELVMPYKNGIG